jgi:hypothetical protein
MPRATICIKPSAVAIGHTKTLAVTTVCTGGGKIVDVLQHDITNERKGSVY